MRKQLLALLALMLVPSYGFPQQNPPVGEPSSAGYISCPVGQSNVFLYQSVSTFDVLASPKCGDRVEILDRVDTMGGYLRVRTAEGKEGFLPQAQVTTVEPPRSKIGFAEAPPVPVPAGQGAPLVGPLSHDRTDYAFDVPRAEIFGGYSYLSADWETMGNRSGMHGWTASSGVNIFPWLGVDGSVSENLKSNCLGAPGLKCTILDVLGGPKISVRPAAAITVFGHGLAGISTLSLAIAPSSLSYRNLAYGFGGGLDYAVTNLISVRLGQLDYIRGQYLKTLGGSHENNVRVSAGIVFRLGRIVSE